MIKSEIKTIGTFNASTGFPIGWEFNCGHQDDWYSRELIPDSVTSWSCTTELTVAGWRFSELREIYRKDFNKRNGLPEDTRLVINGIEY